LKPEILDFFKERIQPFLSVCLKSDKVPIRQSVARVIGSYICCAQGESLKEWTMELVHLVEDPSTDVRVTALHTIKAVAKKKHQVLVPFLPLIIPIIFPRAKDKRVVRVNFAAERALYHLLQIQILNGQTVLKPLVKSLEGPVFKELNEFCKQVLSKTEESDDDDESKI